MNEVKTKLLIFRTQRKLNITVPNIKQFYINSWKGCHWSWHWDWRNSFRKQANILAKKVSTTDGILSKLTYCFKKTSTSIYYSLFQWYIVYGSIIEFFKKKKKKKKICMRFSTFSDYSEHTSPIFKSLETLTLQDI